MAWLMILISLISAIPDILKLIQMIRDLLSNAPKDKKLAYKSELTDIVQRWTFHRNGKETCAELQKLLDKLKLH